jgi:hypothetical protein
MSIAQRRQYPGDMGGVTQLNEKWILWVQRPDLQPDPPLWEIPPKLALYRHQSRATCFLLQLVAAIGIVAVIEAVLPGHCEVSRMACSARIVENGEAEVSRELSTGLEFGARQAERSSVKTPAQHTLHLASQQAA